MTDWQDRRRRCFILAALLGASLLSWFNLPMPLRVVYVAQAWGTPGQQYIPGCMPLELTPVPGNHLVDHPFGTLQVYDLRGKLLLDYDEKTDGEHPAFCGSANGWFYLLTPTARLDAYDTQFNRRWSLQLDSTGSYPRYITADPAGNIYVLINPGQLYAISPAGAVRWHQQDARISSPERLDTTADGSLIVTCYYRALIYRPDGERLRCIEQRFHDSFFVGAERQYLVCLPDSWFKLTAFAITGDCLWSRSTQDKVLTYPGVDGAAGLLLAGSGGSCATGLDEYGRVSWRLEDLAVSTKFCQLADGRIVALERKQASSGRLSELSVELKLRLGFATEYSEMRILQDHEVAASYLVPAGYQECPLIPLPDGSLLIVGYDAAIRRYRIP